jgi:hypothetical protein
MPRGGTRPGAGRKALDQPERPLLTYSLTLRLTDVGYLNQLGRGNLSLGLRRVIDTARIQLPPPPKRPVAVDPPPRSSTGLHHRSHHAQPVAVPGQDEGNRHYG